MNISKNRKRKNKRYRNVFTPILNVVRYGYTEQKWIDEFNEMVRSFTRINYDTATGAGM